MPRSAVKSAARDGVEQPVGRLGDVGDGLLEGLLVALGRYSVAADLAHELERGGADLGVVGGMVKVAEGADAASHGQTKGPP